MKIRTLLLGSVFVAGLSTAGYAADLGVVTSLDVCDELGLTGLTISSDDNCLQISGGVKVEVNYGDFSDVGPYQVYQVDGNPLNYSEGDGTTDETVRIDAWLQFVATASTDFGPASATIKLLREKYDGTGDFTIGVDQAFVGIGDTTYISAGKKSSIFKDGDDAPLNYLGLFNSDEVNTGVGFQGGPSTGGVGVTIETNLGNGVKLGGGFENLQKSSAPAIGTAVGYVTYAGDGVTAHASAAIDETGDWKAHAGFTGTWDPITVVGAIAANDGGWWNALGSVSAKFDMFTLAASAEATSDSEVGVGGSVSAKVTDGVTINLGSKWFSSGVTGWDNYQVEAGVSAAISETLTLTAAIGAADSSNAAVDGFVYGKAGLAWAPGGGFTASIGGEANTLGEYKATFKAAKTIK